MIINRIGIIGLGYVGLPLAVEFAKKFKVVGFDIDPRRVKELRNGVDVTLEVNGDDLNNVLVSASSKNTGLIVSEIMEDLQDCNVYIVTVPTPIDNNKRPVMTPLLNASKMVGQVLKKGDVVIYESTVYPGATEEDCVPELEQNSGLVFNKDFFVGYSPERINPGDKHHTVTKIKKITSGSTQEIGREIDALYGEIIEAGTHLAPSIKVAEAAKVIENAQRDINIAFVNELSKIFNRLGIDTHEVLEAARTKWNFLSFKPGLVGGHCIGVDPYYLAQKSQEVGYNPEIILAGRRVNDGMGAWIASEIVKILIAKGHAVKGSKILFLGVTFKENCPDIRNTKTIDVINELKQYACHVDVYDPWADAQEVMEEYGIELIENFDKEVYDGVVLAVAHEEFKELNPSIFRKGNDPVMYDVKGIWDKEEIDGRL